jgi:hypothetical protein
VKPSRAALTDVRIGLSEAADLHQWIDETQARVFRGIDGGEGCSGTTTASGTTASDTGSPSDVAVPCPSSVRSIFDVSHATATIAP